LITQFFVSLSFHEAYLPLCRIIQDPQYHGLGDHPIQVFFVAFRHNGTEVNKQLLSHLLLASSGYNCPDIQNISLGRTDALCFCFDASF
jgi:hypothetical protein